jgi:hypothetical protein
MSDGCSAIGHATGVRAIVRGCDRANAQGAGKSVILPDGNALSLEGRGGRFVMPGAGCGHGSSRAPVLGGPFNRRVPRTGRRMTAAARRRILRRRQRPERLYRDVIFEPRERQW